MVLVVEDESYGVTKEKGGTLLEDLKRKCEQQQYFFPFPLNFARNLLCFREFQLI